MSILDFAANPHGAYKVERYAPGGWPWADRWWKFTNPRRALIKAAALIVAEIERIDRKAAAQPILPATAPASTDSGAES